MGKLVRLVGLAGLVGRDLNLGDGQRVASLSRCRLLARVEVETLQSPMEIGHRPEYSFLRPFRHKETSDDSDVKMCCQTILQLVSFSPTTRDMRGFV